MSLAPPGTHSYAVCTSNGRQGGYTDCCNAPRAAVWSGDAISYVDLHPIGASSSQVFAVSGGLQVGWARVSVPGGGSQDRALLWFGSAGSVVDLHPTGAMNSYALAGYGAWQGGRVQFVTSTRAAIWQGSAGTWVDLHPSGQGDTSVVLAMSDTQQVGYAGQGAALGACLWSGSAASWVSLHPPSAGGPSRAFGVHGGRQVGWVQTRGASLWQGSAASWIDLHPDGACASSAHAVFDGMQVGEVLLDENCIAQNNHAALWQGSPSSWTDLHEFLPSSFARSTARGIWSDGQTVYITGWGYNGASFKDEALLWSRPIVPPPPCTGDANADRVIDFSDISAVLAAWGQTVAPFGQGDADGNGSVNFADISAVLAAFGNLCD